MNRRVFAVAAAIFAILLVAACATKVPRPTPAQLEVASVRWPDTTLDDLEEGRRLYVRRCSSCHNLPLPTARTIEEWPPIIEDMGEYAQFDEHQTELVERYVISALETPPPPEEKPRQQ
jgi:cytochrome c5